MLRGPVFTFSLPGAARPLATTSVMPLLRDNALHTHTQHWSTGWNRGAVACFERYVQRDMLCRVSCNNRLHD